MDLNVKLAPSPWDGRLPAGELEPGEQRRMPLVDDRAASASAEVGRDRRAIYWNLETGSAWQLYRARSRLYRSQILQVNMRLKALAEVYTMQSFAQL